MTRKFDGILRREQWVRALAILLVAVAAGGLSARWLEKKGLAVALTPAPCDLPETSAVRKQPEAASSSTAVSVAGTVVPGHPLPARSSRGTSLDGRLTASRPFVVDYGKLPLSFEANQGQSAGQVKFLAHGRGYTVFLTPEEATFSLDEAGPNKSRLPTGKRPVHPQPAIRLKFSGAEMPSSITGRDQLLGKSNYFIGNDPKQWHTNVPNYAAVEYHGIYPGVNAIFHGDRQRLEFDFDVAAGADPRAIGLQVEGVRRMRLNHAGDVVLHTDAMRDVVMGKPHIYQQSPEGRREIAGRYVFEAQNRIVFALGPYDRSQPLLIDPTVGYATYLGGSSYDYAQGIAVDSSGDTYVTGFTSSTNFPTVSPYQGTCVDCSGQYTGNAFVAKLNPAGSALVYSTYLGGASTFAIAIDSSGSAYVTGSAQTGLPTLNPYQATSHGTISNAFVTKLSPDGSALIYSTYLGGDYFDEAFGIAVDSSGSAYVTGLTNSTGFPTMNPIQAACDDCAGSASLYDGDAFVTKFNAAGSALVYSTYLGGSTQDVGQAIAVDSAGNAYVTGYTQSINFPTANPFQAANGSTILATTGENAFVTKFNPAGSALIYSTYLGGSDEDLGLGIAVDSSSSAYVTGFAQSRNFPTMNPLQAKMDGVNDAFVTKFNPAGSALVYSTYLGGISADQGNSIAVDSTGNAYVTGSTASTNFPLVSPTQTTCSSCSSYTEAFVAKVNATGSTLVFSTYLGGGNKSSGASIGVDASGNAYVAGSTASTDFPTVDPLQTTNKSAYGTAFVAKFEFTAAVGAPASIVAVSGTGQTSFQGTAFSNPLVVLVEDVNGNPVSGVAVTFSGDGVSFSNSGVATTNSSGEAQITATPTASGNLTVTAAVSGLTPTATFSLTGEALVTAPSASLSPASLTFGPQVSGTPSAAQSVTLSNTGDAALNITGSGIGVIGSNAADFSQSNQCGSSVAAGGSCAISVTFTPSLSAGSETAALNVTDNASGSPQQVQLSGIALPPASVTCSVPAISLTGDAATVKITCTATDFTGMLSLNCNLPASLSTYVTCSFSPNSLDFTSSTTQGTTTLTIQPVASALLERKNLPGMSFVRIVSLGAVFGLPVWLLGFRRKMRKSRRVFLFLLISLCCMQAVTACGGGSSSGGNGNSTSAPAGTYQATIALTGTGLKTETITFNIQVP